MLWGPEQHDAVASAQPANPDGTKQHCMEGHGAASLCFYSLDSTTLAVRVLISRIASFWMTSAHAHCGAHTKSCCIWCECCWCQQAAASGGIGS